MSRVILMLGLVSIPGCDGCGGCQPRDTDDPGFKPSDLPDRCLLDDIPALVEAYPDALYIQDGQLFYVLEGGRSVWCDLPGIQATPEGRELFVPLDGRGSAVFELCHDPAAGTVACEFIPDPATWREEVWTCSDGTDVPIGYWADWTCAGLPQEGDLEWRIVMTWELEL